MKILGERARIEFADVETMEAWYPVRVLEKVGFELVRHEADADGAYCVYALDRPV